MDNHTEKGVPELLEASRHVEGSGPQLISALEQFFGRYVVVPPGIPLVLSLFALQSYLWQTFEHCGYLVLSSPAKRSGKTTTAVILSWLCCRPQWAVDPSGAATYRLIDACQPTMLFDEAEICLQDRRIRPLLNAGFRRGATVPRCVGGQVVEFSTYCPKVFCTLSEIPETIRDRSIVISMRRAKPSEIHVELRERDASNTAAQLAKEIASWATAARNQIADCYAATTLGFLADREANIWAPLFSIAAVAIPERLDDLKVTALRLIHEKARQDSELSPAVRLLSDLKAVFAEERVEKLPTDRLIKALQRLPVSPWNGLSSNALANYLRPFGIKSKQLWVDGRNQHGYRLQDLQDSLERYVSDTEESSADSEEDNENPAA